MFKILNQRYHPFAKWERIYSINPSNYVRKGTLQVFQKIRRQFPNDYIVCIGYDRGDTQFALTETFKRYEHNVEDVIDRCLLEECSVERTSKTNKPDVYVYNEKHATIYCVPFRVTEETIQPSREFMEDDKDLNRQDDKTRKLVLLLHGDLATIKKVFSKFYSVEKEILHLMAIPCLDVQRVFPKFFPHHFYSYQSYPLIRPFTPVY